MKISILQLNTNSDNYWDRLIPFLKSNDFDVMQFQEITGKNTATVNINSKIDTFKELQMILQDTYSGELVISQKIAGKKDAYLGNATFFKKSFSLVSKDICTINADDENFEPEDNIPGRDGRTLLNLRLDIGGNEISFLNTHLSVAKTSEEHSYQTKQGEVLLSYLENVPRPFVLTGDFNLSPDQPLIKKLNGLARNLIEENKITNTLNPRTHRARHLFPAGVAVDYVFVSSGLRTFDFEVIDKEDISDHLGMRIVVEA